ncbi:proton pump-interactor 1 [Sesamum indicum]|uniref:proton pump-interactor 1 n=1 Tax=Sesamum indicum TaxID=4182 RepID=A0A6I9TFJ1_SESIN|nr:proton pump-interactor 1 [Sesamum indicum]XP_011082688.1 proton pump-interactor 1 [Sesamum indicum]XP_011082689.1 proton pump-interactor 1 [Sesamum indicum]
MGVEVVDSNLPVIETGSEANMSVANEKVNIKFGSHVVDEPVKGEVNKVSESNLPKDAVDEWPEPKQIHSFYVVRYRALEDQKLKAKLDVAEKELQKKNQARSQIVEKIRAKRADRSQIIAQIRSLSVENKQFRTIMDEKRKEMEPLQQALGKLRGTSGGRDRGSGVCSSEEELNDIIKSLQYRIQHESIPLSEEKQILREIKQLEGTREKVIANAAERARIQDSLGEKEVIQGQVKLIGNDLDGVRKEKQVIHAKLKQLDEEKLALEKEISVLEGELTAITEKRDKTFETIKEMRKQREDGNSPFYQNRMLLTKAKAIAANKDVDALKELSDTEVEKFMSLWNSDKAFRGDYERRILSSLDMRQLSKDGRLRNPGEKPLVQPETSTTSEAEVVKTSAKQTPKENAVSPAHIDASSEQKVQKTKGAKNNKEGNKKTETTLEKIDKADEEEFFTTVKSQKESLPKRDEVDEMKLKELKRQEEIAKRNQAEERKKKLAEKAAAKAAIKAQKDAEKKLKEREKRARKKNGATAPAEESEESTEAVAEVAETEKVEEKIETPAPQKNRDRKENTIRHRGRPRGPDSLPKAILKRKKATNYWIWAAPAALVILVLVFVGYNYLS